MGKLIKPNASEIKPSQDFVKEGTVGYILECIVNGEEDKLPPTPIVRNNPNGSGYIAIDGHNLIIIYELLGRECQVYLAESKDDKLEGFPSSSPRMIEERKKELFEKYDKVIDDVLILEKQGITTFSSLGKKYDFLKDVDSAKKHYNLG